MTKPDPIRIVSRASLLARWQAEYVASLLDKKGIPSEIIYLTTTGDRVQNRFLHEIGGKGLFTKELEECLLEKKADLAVHSLKDMPARVQAPFAIGAYLKRHSPRDLMIYNPRFLDSSSPKGFQNKALSREDLAAWTSCEIATGSLRRREILNMVNPLIAGIAIRGNVDTRLKKLEESQWKGLILAEASLDRLQLKDKWPCQALGDDWFVPAPAQGILAIECLEESQAKNQVLADLLRDLNHATTQRAAEIERGILAALGGDCTLPYGCIMKKSEKSGDESLHTLLFTAAEGCFEIKTMLDPAKPSQQVVVEAVQQLLAIDRGGCIEKMVNH